jgi:hypothetical protein
LVALGFWLGLVAVGPGRCGQLRVNLSIRMVAVRRGRRQEDEEEQSIQGPRAKCQGLLLDWRKHFLLPTISVPQNKPQPPQNYTTVGSLTLPLPLLLTGTSAMGQAQLLRSSYITATLGAERGCERQHFRWSSHYLPQAWRRACHAGPRRLTLCSGAQEQERYQINVRTIEARDEAQEAKMEAVSAGPKARAIVIARSSSNPLGHSCPLPRLWSISGLCYGSSCTRSCSATLTARVNHQAAHGTPAVGGVTWHRSHSYLNFSSP